MNKDSEDNPGPGIPPPRKGLARLIAATRYSIDGLHAALKNEEAARLEIAALLVAVPLALWLGETTVEKVLLIGAVVLVLIVELLNTAIEALVNRFGSEYHELSKVAKDTSSAAVLIAVLLGLFTWVMILTEAIA